MGTPIKGALRNGNGAAAAGAARAAAARVAGAAAAGAAASAGAATGGVNWASAAAVVAAVVNPCRLTDPQ